MKFIELDYSELRRARAAGVYSLYGVRWIDLFDRVIRDRRLCDYFFFGEE